MNSKIIIRYLLICICLLSSCANKSASHQNATSKSLINTNPDSLMKLYSVEKNKYLTFDTLKFLIPADVNINPDNIYNGIYEIEGNYICRHKSLIFNNLAFLTTYEDLGRGFESYLYVFDIKSKSLIKDSSFKRNYLYSAAGIFIIDRSTQTIFPIDRPEWYDGKQEFIIPASIYYIKGCYFEHLKNVYKVGDEIPTDTALVSFFNKSMDTNNKEVKILPHDWWKTGQ